MATVQPSSARVVHPGGLITWTFSFTNFTGSGWILVENNSNVNDLRDTIFAASHGSCDFFQICFYLALMESSSV